MNSEDKQKSAQAMRELKEAIASMVAASEEDRETIVSKFPKPAGLGTDGTCWSELEHIAYCQSVIRHGSRLLANSDYATAGSHNAIREPKE